MIYQKVVPVRKFTYRERAVLSLLAEDMTNMEIAERLSLTRHTVYTHMRNIRRKVTHIGHERWTREELVEYSKRLQESEGL